MNNKRGDHFQYLKENNLNHLIGKIKYIGKRFPRTCVALSCCTTMWSLSAFGGEYDIFTVVLSALVVVTVSVLIRMVFFNSDDSTERRIKEFMGSLKGDPSDWDDFENEAIREKALLMMAMKNGPTFRMHCRGHVKDALGAENVCATCDPALVKEIFLNKKHTVNRPKRYLLAQHLPGLDGVLFQEGEKWKEHTRALLPVFHSSNFSQFGEFMHWATLAHMGLDGGGDGGGPKPLNAEEFVTGLGTDAIKNMRVLGTTIILAAGYGVDPDSEEGRQLRDAIMGYDEKARFRRAGKNPFKLLYALYLVWSDAQRIKAAVKRIVDGRARREKTSESGNFCQPWANPKSLNWIDGMINANFSLHDISNEVNHLHAAHKAIAIMITFAMYELARKKQWQDKAREEFLSVLGEGSDKYPSKDVLEKLPICMSIWKETLRMHPISLGVLRETGADIETKRTDAGESMLIPGGTPIEVLLQALHFHPDYWNSPEEFDPGRWKDNTSQRSTLSDRGVKNAFVPFLDGQRQCQGRFLAELEFAVVLNAVLSKHEVSVPKDYKFVIKTDFFPEMKDPIRLITKKYKRVSKKPSPIRPADKTRIVSLPERRYSIDGDEILL
jgi:cytochrome P450